MEQQQKQQRHRKRKKRERGAAVVEINSKKGVPDNENSNEVIHGKVASKTSDDLRKDNKVMSYSMVVQSNNPPKNATRESKKSKNSSNKTTNVIGKKMKEFGEGKEVYDALMHNHEPRKGSKKDSGPATTKQTNPDSQPQRQLSSSDIRKKLVEEGSDARNLASWSVRLDSSQPEKKKKATNSRSNKYAMRPRNSTYASNNAYVDDMGDINDNAEDVDIGGHTSSSMPTSPQRYTQRKRAASSESLFSAASIEKNLKGRHWRYLFNNLNMSIDELYRTCEVDRIDVECQEVIMVLQNAKRDFESLISSFHVQATFEGAPPGLTPNVAWEIRKATQPQSVPLQDVHHLQSSLDMSNVASEEDANLYLQQVALLTNTSFASHHSYNASFDGEDVSIYSHPQFDTSATTSIYGYHDQSINSLNASFVSTGALFDLDTRAPGKGVRLHQRLSSPARKKSSIETAKEMTERHRRAELNRSQRQQEQTKRIKDHINKVEKVRDRRVEKEEKVKEDIERRHQRAEELRECHLQEVVRKGREEKMKMRENQFIKDLKEDERKQKVLERMGDEQSRLEALEASRKKKIQDRAKKKEAVVQRKKKMEEDRQEKLRLQNEEWKKRVDAIERERSHSRPTSANSSRRPVSSGGRLTTTPNNSQSTPSGSKSNTFLVQPTSKSVNASPRPIPSSKPQAGIGGPTIEQHPEKNAEEQLLANDGAFKKRCDTLKKRLKKLRSKISKREKGSEASIKSSLEECNNAALVQHYDAIKHLVSNVNHPSKTAATDVANFDHLLKAVKELSHALTNKRQPLLLLETPTMNETLVVCLVSYLVIQSCNDATDEQLRAFLSPLSVIIAAGAEMLEKLQTKDNSAAVSLAEILCRAGVQLGWVDILVQGLHETKSSQNLNILKFDVDCKDDLEDGRKQPSGKKHGKGKGGSKKKGKKKSKQNLSKAHAGSAVIGSNGPHTQQSHVHGIGDVQDDVEACWTLIGGCSKLLLFLLHAFTRKSHVNGCATAFSETTAVIDYKEHVELVREIGLLCLYRDLYYACKSSNLQHPISANAMAAASLLCHLQSNLLRMNSLFYNQSHELFFSSNCGGLFELLSICTPPLMNISSSTSSSIFAKDAIVREKLYLGIGSAVCRCLVSIAQTHPNKFKEICSDEDMMLPVSHFITHSLRDASKEKTQTNNVRNTLRCVFYLCMLVPLFKERVLDGVESTSLLLNLCNLPLRFFTSDENKFAMFDALVGASVGKDDVLHVLINHISIDEIVQYLQQPFKLIVKQVTDERGVDVEIEEASLLTEAERKMALDFFTHKKSGTTNEKHGVVAVMNVKNDESEKIQEDHREEEEEEEDVWWN
eukprot:m.80094 g.80094  ORF g.80094 m.80094 type:complete len:1344 (-) comp8617_c1_seq2:143-4174(-)